jgi:hypothetical protein
LINSSLQPFDYDLDGDFRYVFAQSYTRRIFGSSEVRNKRSYECGDKLFRNDNGKFIDVSEQAGIFWCKWVWSRLAVSDFNLDGPDIYVGNDFHEDDYFK